MAKKPKKEKPAKVERPLSAYFDGLEPTVLLFAVVGRFFSTWSMMELELNRAITAALGLKSIQGIIVTAEIEFSKKVQMARAAVNMSVIDPKESERFDQHLIRISELSNMRNIIAHNFFNLANNDKDIEFTQYRAKAKLEIATKTYSLREFQAVDEELAMIQATLKELGALLKKRPEHLLELSQALAGVGYPASPIGLLGSWNAEAQKFTSYDISDKNPR